MEEIEKVSKLGWKLIPVQGVEANKGCTCTEHEKCQAIGKHPIGNKWSENATADLSIIKKWPGRWPSLNYGVVTGEPNSFFVLDVDERNGGIDTLKELEKIHGELPLTPMALTGGGGAHYYFKLPDFKFGNKTNLFPGLDIKTTGGFVVAPPSKHKSGKLYAWSTDQHPEDVPLSGAPGWLLKELRKSSPTISLTPQKIEKGKRNDTLYRIASKLRGQGKTELEIYAALHEINSQQDEPLPDRELLSVTHSGAKFDPGKPGKVTDEALTEMANAISPHLKMLVTKDATQYFHVTDEKKKELAVVANEHFLKCQIKDILGVQDAVVGKVFSKWMLHKEATLDHFPKAFCWPNEEETWCFKRLDFMPEQGVYPAWKEWLNRLSVPEEFMAYIWSIFEPRTSGRQFLWLYDPIGQAGKSKVIDCISQVLGEAATAINGAAVRNDRFLGQLVRGKRLVTWADCKHDKFPMTETLRNITSGDKIVVDEKGKPAFAMNMYAKLIIGSNMRPSITGAGADKSRLLRLDVGESANKDDETWPARLMKEMPYVLYDCQKMYGLLCPHHGNIKLSALTKAKIEESTHSLEERWQIMVEKHFRIIPGAEVSMREWGDVLEMERLSGNTRDIGELKTYLERTHNIVRTRRATGERDYFYPGISKKNTF